MHGREICIRANILDSDISNILQIKTICHRFSQILSAYTIKIQCVSWKRFPLLPVHYVGYINSSVHEKSVHWRNRFHETICIKWQNEIIGHIYVCIGTENISATFQPPLRPHKLKGQAREIKWSLSFCSRHLQVPHYWSQKIQLHWFSRPWEGESMFLNCT